jgi:hypothetical protein
VTPEQIAREYSIVGKKAIELRNRVRPENPDLRSQVVDFFSAYYQAYDELFTAGSDGVSPHVKSPAWALSRVRALDYLIIEMWGRHAADSGETIPDWVVLPSSTSSGSWWPWVAVGAVAVVASVLVLVYLRSR